MKELQKQEYLKEQARAFKQRVWNEKCLSQIYSIPNLYFGILLHMLYTIYFHCSVLGATIYTLHCLSYDRHNK
jgi:hypothetical protein